MSRNYKFHKPEAAYFVRFAVFIRNEYKDILVDSLEFGQKEMETYAWCIMTNHVHLVFRGIGDYKAEQISGDFNRFTSKAVVIAEKTALKVSCG